MKFGITLFFCMVFLGMTKAQMFWTNLNSPSTARYYAIAHNGAKMYASNGLIGTAAGQFYFKQGTGSWNVITTSGVATFTSINNIYCTVSGTLILTGSQGATGVVYKSTDDGSTWTQSTYSLVGFNQSIVEDASGNIYIYKIGGTGVTFLKSTDGGSTFFAPNSSFNTNFLTVSGNVLYAAESGTSAWNIMKSTDGGQTWNATANNLTLGSQSFVRATPNGAVYIDNQIKSTDGGASWVAMNTPPSGSVFFVDMANNYFVANEPTNLYVSVDGGINYIDVINGLNLSPTISIQYRIPTADGKMYLSTTSGSSYSLFEYTGGPVGLSNENKISETVNVFPNPAKDKIQIETSGKICIAQIRLMDLMGNTLKIIFPDMDKCIIDLSGLGSGTYILKMINDHNEISTKKIVLTN